MDREDRFFYNHLGRFHQQRSQMDTAGYQRKYYVKHLESG